MPYQTSNPFASTRLEYRAIELPQDIALFAAINADRIGYANSNGGNIRLPKSANAEIFAKGCSECFLGTIIVLKDSELKRLSKSETTPATKSEKEDSPTPLADVNKHGLAIGHINLDSKPPHLRHHRRHEISIDILPEFQGRGYGKEAIEWILDYAFLNAGLHSVKIRVFGWNEGALRLYQKIGFTVEGREREALWHEGRFWDGVDLGMLDREWMEIRKARKTGVAE